MITIIIILNEKSEAKDYWVWSDRVLFVGRIHIRFYWGLDWDPVFARGSDDFKFMFRVNQFASKLYLYVQCSMNIK